MHDIPRACFSTKRSYSMLVGGQIKATCCTQPHRFHFERRPLKTIELRDHFSRWPVDKLSDQISTRKCYIMPICRASFFNENFFSEAPRDFLSHARARLQSIHWRFFRFNGSYKMQRAERERDRNGDAFLSLPPATYCTGSNLFR